MEVGVVWDCAALAGFVGFLLGFQPSSGMREKAWGIWAGPAFGIVVGRSRARRDSGSSGCWQGGRKFCSWLTSGLENTREGGGHFSLLEGAYGGSLFGNSVIKSSI